MIVFVASSWNMLIYCYYICSFQKHICSWLRQEVLPNFRLNDLFNPEAQ